jgi:hypothetical protein
MGVPAGEPEFLVHFGLFLSREDDRLDGTL